jgi:hypothetical protein
MLIEVGDIDELRALVSAPNDVSVHNERRRGAPHTRVCAQCNTKDIEISLIERRLYQALGVVYATDRSAGDASGVRKALDVWRKIGTDVPVRARVCMCCTGVYAVRVCELRADDVSCVCDRLRGRCWR